MADNTDPLRSLFVDKAKLKSLLHEKDERDEQSPRVYKTVQELRQAMIEQGIRPENNEFSRAVIAAWYEIYTN